MGLPRNMSAFDRVARTLMGAALIALSCYGFDIIPVYWLSLFAFWFGVVNILSSICCWCFMYSIVGVSTRVGQDGEH